MYIPISSLRVIHIYWFSIILSCFTNLINFLELQCHG
ncbi:hypothetical protein Goari_019285 [Gossypium aridum]|uniref:Uncharacterized protein n=1 Tax=Gossypium aridum TaxID=34290 RepID=A0A7J8WSC9_GOSAI|nr:hypothetical protein [Gossypium aridum]